ncbi:hypothetical protein EDS67_00495 [candidate division KSB1 bacterium]|nr:MAG: hypothetical protein EDS67_00495 [candidate division KSB1 bacterium]MBC6946972.1 hypothetical protein [candidate division KSB1 bacterium]MCE7940150.1 hypothetical protein [Chlorobi bacterium CHB1]MDL1873553.1 hypothetical protein [Cytophagia bacterium CHB2]
MIQFLEVKNFKSIKQLALDCKKINIILGRPNTGKSNLLESIGLFSLPLAPLRNLKELVRFENMTNLFNDHDLSQVIEINADTMSLQIKFDRGEFKGELKDKEHGGSFKFSATLKEIRNSEGDCNTPFRFYRFATLEVFTNQEADFLMPVNGENLSQILLTNKESRKMAANVFSEYGLKIVLKQSENKIEVQKEIEDAVISFPYALVSDTLRRIVFHHVAIETNHDSIIIFEEPEAHAFPYYTKFLAERIALDSSNQYFISTHNPYFLISVLEKAPKDDVGIFVASSSDSVTQLEAVSPEACSEILGLDASVFFNLERFLGET